MTARRHTLNCLVIALGKWIREQKPAPATSVLTVAIAGDGALGKTTVSRLLAQHLGILRIEADAYGMDRDTRLHRGILHLEDRRSFRRGEFLGDVERAKRHERVESDRWYDHSTGKIRSRAVARAIDRSILLVDGSGLLHPEFDGSWDIAILLDAAGSVRKQLRLQADLSRGYSPHASAANWDRYRNLYYRRIRPWSQRAKLTISVGLDWKYGWQCGILDCACRTSLGSSSGGCKAE